MYWLLLIITLPTDSATTRMRAWRALKASGAAVLRDGVYLMPGDDAHTATLSDVERDVAAAGGSAYLLRAHDPADYGFAALFDRADEYRDLAVEIEACRAALAEQGPDGIQRRVRKLRQNGEALASIDFFPGHARDQVRALLDDLERALAVAQSPDEPRGVAGEVRRLAPADYRGRRWATRAGLWVDRIACAWLIRRFIDTDAKMLWLAAPGDCPPDAIGFDFDGAEFSHIDAGGRLLVTFEVLLESFGLAADPALLRLARVVHCLDVGGLPVPEAPGLERLLRGIKARTGNDDELLHEAGRVFDDLHLAFGEEGSAA